MLTLTSDATYSVADPLGNPLPSWTGGNVVYQQGRTLLFQNEVVAEYDDATNTVVFTNFTWTPVGNIILPGGAVPEYVEAQFIKESNLRDTKSFDYISFTVSGFKNNNSPISIDSNNVRSVNEDVLKAGYSLFRRMLQTPSYLKTSVMNLLGHGAPLYIMSPDVSALTSLGPQGEMAIWGNN